MAIKSYLKLWAKINKPKLIFPNQLKATK
jgi:hypothetical protein